MIVISMSHHADSQVLEGPGYIAADDEDGDGIDDIWAVVEQKILEMVQCRNALRNLVLDIGLDDVSRLLRRISRIFSNIHSVLLLLCVLLLYPGSRLLARGFVVPLQIRTACTQKRGRRINMRQPLFQV